METVYIVTSGSYSDYGIDAVFKDKSKAELYCSCHRDCQIEEYNLSDNDILTPFNSVVIRFNIIRKNKKERIDFQFQHLAKEDAIFYTKNLDDVFVHDKGWMSITLYRRLPDNYEETTIREKYTKVYHDLRSEILYIQSEHDCSSYENRKECAKDIEEYIKGKFGIEMDDEQ